MKTHSVLSACCALALLLPTSSPGLAARLEERAQVIRSAEHELRWQRIPWLVDLAEAEQLAREESRPIFLWVTGDDPLERC